MNSALMYFAAMLSLQEPVVIECKREPVKIAIVDTGIGYMQESFKAKLCATGHKDFGISKISSKGFGTIKPPLDFHSHGTNIAGIIDENLKNSGVDYCLIIVKFWDATMTNEQAVNASVQALEYISILKPDIVNYSAGGPHWNSHEYRAIKTYLDNGGTFVAAAGNDGQDLDQFGNSYFPAMYDKRIVVVGNKNRNGTHAISSNFGSVVKRWEIGTNVVGFGLLATGTSQATAQATAKIAGQLKKSCVK